MEKFFRFCNFRQFARTRREIRLPLEMLRDSRLLGLGDEAKAHVISLLLLAARCDNRLPDDPVLLANSIGATTPIDLDELRRRGIIEELPTAAPPPKRESTRYVPDTVRAQVIVRDGGRCRRCGSARQIEIDHIVPLSKAGTSEEGNLQVLCRRCNRRKLNHHAASF